MGVEITPIFDTNLVTLHRQIFMSVKEKTLMQKQVEKFLKYKIIEKTCREPDDFISNIFPIYKRSGDIRLILNLKRFNELISTIHFKMESIQDALDLMFPGCFFYSVDLRDAFYSFSVRRQDRRFLKILLEQ